MKYIIYARKSTEEDDRQVLSIEAQLVELKEFAAKEKLEIVASFQEAKTAKEPGRMKFAEMLSLIEEGKADGIVSWHPDRLARNSVDGGKIIHFVDRGLIRALKFPCFWFEPTPQGLFMLNIAFGQSKYFVDNLRENVKRGLRQKIRNGVWPSWAPVGYLNNAKTRGIDVDKEKAPKVRKIFEMYATGAYSLNILANWCEKKKLLTNADNKISLSNVQHILQNPFYIGLMRYKGEIFEGMHEPLISKKLFDKCQEVMTKRGKVRPDRKHSFAFLGLMKCASCGCSITAQYAKGNGGIYTYYRCTKKRGVCQEKYLGENQLVSQIKTFLQKVSLSSQDTEKVLVALDTEENQAKEQAQSEVVNLKEQLSQVETRIQKLLDVYLDDTLTQKEYAAKKDILIFQKVALSEKITDFETKGLSWLEPAREFVKSLNQATNLLESENLSEMTTFLKNRNREFLFAPKNPYDLVAERSEATSESLTFPTWCLGPGSNRRPPPLQGDALPTELPKRFFIVYHYAAVT
ncbi:MAG: Recombinase [Candidatus Adlerbacteria bacterium GW2011_GWB1_54_7]|uniref:Recombinase n=1 Tax=Candidatus Adlerbacteria bacterium GW2011_GWB1_54_7 TaxID=1618607 RepID=A0A0G1Y2Q5_9BACT|nr:MAG: Recombinase [Candidatus Adlerbacteria bacterium GW2011_GWB1_54_7]